MFASIFQHMALSFPAQGLQLPSQAAVSSDQGQLDNLQSGSSSDVLTALNSSSLAAIIPPDTKASIAGEIALCDETARSMWNFWITPNSAIGSTSGATSWLGIRASRSPQAQLRVEWFHVQASVQFQQPTNPVQRERKSSSRRYLIAGPRDKHRWIEHVPRGLTADEVARVKTFLEDAIRQQPLFLNWPQS